MINTNSLFFTIITFDKDHEWNELINLTEGFLSPLACGQLEQLMKKCTRSIVIEHQYIDKDYRDTFSHFHSRRFVTVSSRCYRLHFFKTKIINLEEAAHLQENYLGYSIIRPTKPNSIGRSLFSPECRKPLGHILVCKEHIMLRSVELSVQGFPFISQDCDATVCAESVMWMMIRYFSNKYNLYRERYPFEITKMTENHAIGRRVYPSGGLSVWQISESLRFAGFSTLVYGCDLAHSATSDQRLKFNHQLATYIESGIPLILAVPGHVVLALGHKHSKAKPLSKRFTFSSEFYDALIINDDNTPVYEELSLNSVASPSFPISKYSFESIDAFVVPLAEKIFLRVEDFEAVVMTLIKGQDFGIDTHSKSLKGKNLILRVFLTTGRSFKKKIPDRGGMGNNIAEFLYKEMPLPHFIWVCEISTLDEYNKENVFGEIVWDATRNAHEPTGFITIHYPEVLWFDDGALFNKPQDLLKVDLTGSVPYLLYKSNLQEY